MLRGTLLTSFALALCSAAPLVAQTRTKLPPHAGTPAVDAAASLSGQVTEQAGGAPVAQARVTLFLPDLSFFREVRSASDGSYDITDLTPGTFRLGFAAPDFEYLERTVVLSRGVNQSPASLAVETEVGLWEVIGNTLPETLDASDIGVLLPDGWIFYCHNTTDSILFDPESGQKILPPPSFSEQGCMNSTLLADGSVLLVGGQDGSDPGDFVNGIPWVKRFTPPATWEDLADLQHAAGRWYPGLARLNDGSVVAMGGGQAPDASRTETAEQLDLQTLTWSYTGSLLTALEFPPAALLLTGQVLQTWGGMPQLYDPVLGSWSPTGNFVYPNRGWPGHSDHSLLVLTDGWALAVGANRNLEPMAEMTEFYDPQVGAWSLGTSPDLIRYQAEVVYLPDGQVFVGGGDKGFQGGTEPDVLGIVRRCDLLDPRSGAWRRVPDMQSYREYHAVTLLLPDGRIATTGGTLIKFQVGPTSSDVEAYSPPYLFRGVRPQLSALSDANPARGQTVQLEVFPETRLTHVVLMGMQSTTHWVDGGIPRRLELGVTQTGTQVTFTVPPDADLAPLGWYMLFGMVDDIPSRALSLRVDP